MRITHCRTATPAIVLAAAASLILSANGCDAPQAGAPPRLANVGQDHNRALSVLEREAPVPRGALTMDAFGGMLRATQNYYVHTQDADRALVARVTQEIVRTLHASGLVQERGGREYVDLGGSPESLLRVIDYQAGQGLISTRFAQALRGVYEYGSKVQDDVELLEYIESTIGGVAWEKNDQLAADAFVEVARYSAAYWPGGDNEPAGKPKWVTILADALGAAGGGVVGSLAGGPIGAGIGAGLVSAAVSHVFGRTIGSTDTPTGPRR